MKKAETKYLMSTTKTILKTSLILLKIYFNILLKPLIIVKISNHAHHHSFARIQADEEVSHFQIRRIHNNKELNFEDLEAGIIRMLKTSFPQIKAILPRAGSIISGEFKQFCIYQKIFLK